MIDKVIKKQTASDQSPKSRKIDITKYTEENTKESLSVWLEGYGCNIFWEKKNEYNRPVFNTQNLNGGTCEKPDLLVRALVNGSHVYYVIEVKNGQSDSNVYDSFPQLLRYAEGKLLFSIGETPISVSGYFVATQFSERGRLFFKDVSADSCAFSDSRWGAIARGEIPRNEYILTEQYTRLLWRMAKLTCSETRIGALLSTVLNGARVPSPMFQYADIRGNAGFQGTEILHKTGQ